MSEEFVTLNSGFQMPIIGLGLWRMHGKEIKSLLVHAIKLGYRHFDCAAHYKNEAEVGEALAEAFQTGLVKREELFVTTKVWNSDHRHVVEACKDSLKKLQLDYLDLYLVHFPVASTHSGADENELSDPTELALLYHEAKEKHKRGSVSQKCTKFGGKKARDDAHNSHGGEPRDPKSGPRKMPFN